MNGLVLLVLIAIAPQRAVRADTSIYIENVLWPHASQNTAQNAAQASKPASPATPVNEPIPGLQPSLPPRRPFPITRQ